MFLDAFVVSAGADDSNSSSGDDADEEDVQLLQAMLATQPDSAQ